jgi:hypothetical protein
MYVLFVAIAILLVFLLCVCYNLMWLLVPQLGALSRVMRLYKNQLRKNCTKTNVPDKDMLGELYNIYYGNRCVFQSLHISTNSYVNTNFQSNL